MSEEYIFGTQITQDEDILASRVGTLPPRIGALPPLNHEPDLTYDFKSLRSIDSPLCPRRSDDIFTTGLALNTRVTPELELEIPDLSLEYKPDEFIKPKPAMKVKLEDYLD